MVRDAISHFVRGPARNIAALSMMIMITPELPADDPFRQENEEAGIW
jgi:hypothetical protein